MTFDNISNLAYRMIGFNQWFTSPCLGRLAERLITWTGCTLDNVEASRILAEKGIREIIIQAGTGISGDTDEFQDDGMIPKEASLGHALASQKITQNKKFKHIKDAEHGVSSAILDQAIIEALIELDHPKPS